MCGPKGYAIFLNGPGNILGCLPLFKRFFFLSKLSLFSANNPFNFLRSWPTRIKLGWTFHLSDSQRKTLSDHNKPVFFSIGSSNINDIQQKKNFFLKFCVKVAWTVFCYPEITDIHFLSNSNKFV